MVEAWQTQTVDAVSLQTTQERTRNNLRLVPHANASTSRRILNPESVRFAHPAEASIAELLSSHQVAWQYEPTTFPLITTEDGSPIQSFTPDFYLPLHDVYIEMTTMRQSLVTRKNRKFRLLREIYPELNVRLLYRKDVELIVERYGLAPFTHVDVAGPVVATAELIRRNVHEIASDLSLGSDLTLIALGSGAISLTREIASEINSVQASKATVVSLANPRKRANRPGNDFGLSETINSNARLVLVADVIGTGLTVAGALDWLSERGHSVEGIVTLADRPSARLVNLPATRSIVSAPSAWLVGAGLGNTATLSRLPDLHQVASPSGD